MTLDRIDEELTLLRTIADGDGEFVDLDGLPERSVNILKDLESEGYVSGQILLDGSARFRITAAGDRYFEGEFQKRLDYENASYASERAIPKKDNLAIHGQVRLAGFGWCDVGSRHRRYRTSSVMRLSSSSPENGIFRGASAPHRARPAPQGGRDPAPTLGPGAMLMATDQRTK